MKFTYNAHEKCAVISCVLLGQTLVVEL